MAVAPATASVIIPTYNAAPSVARTLASLEALPAKHLAEVFVCDDGSEDGTEETVKRFASRLPVHYLRQEKHGFRAAAARNIGIKRAKGDISIFIDADVVLPLRFLEAHILRHHTPIQGRLVFGYRRRVRIAPLPSTELSQIIDYETDHREAQLAPEGQALKQSTTPWYFAYSCNLSVSGQLRRQLFDEEFVGWGNEDLEFAYRAVASGAEIAAAPEASLWHVEEGPIRDPFRLDPNIADFTSFVLNTVRMQLKHASDPVLWSHLEADLVGYRVDGGRCLADACQSDSTPIRLWATSCLSKTSNSERMASNDS
jgi:glycosyltransferase involved in cell wall biosynthesis